MMALYILMGVVGVLSVLVFIKVENLLKTNRDIVGELRRIAEGQRLSTVFAISPSSLTIDPAEFEPQRPVIRERLMKAFETEDHPDPGTLAYCILDHSGWNEFVDGKTFQDAQKALGRLLANKNTKAGQEVPRHSGRSTLKPPIYTGQTLHLTGAHQSSGTFSRILAGYQKGVGQVPALFSFPKL